MAGRLPAKNRYAGLMHRAERAPTLAPVEGDAPVLVGFVEEAVVGGGDLVGREAVGDELGQAEASGRDEVEDGAGVAGDGEGMSPGWSG